MSRRICMSIRPLNGGTNGFTMWSTAVARASLKIGYYKNIVNTGFENPDCLTELYFGGQDRCLGYFQPRATVIPILIAQCYSLLD